MACCGSGTASGRAKPMGSPAYGSPSVSAPLVAYFRNSGTSAISAVGPVSGRLYRFPASGQAVAVDSRDAASIARIPRLQNVTRH
jgi:hypothetical protein